MKGIKEIVVSAVALTVIAAVTTAALAATNALTEDTIAQRTQESENQARRQVMEADRFEVSTLTVDGKDVVYYTAFQGDDTVGYVFTTVTTGKSSGLTVMTGISTDSKITGVTVTEDSETAGYVDKVEKGGLFQAITGRSAEELRIGDNIDAISQATKTSKGVINGVNQAISYYHSVKGEIS